MPGFFFERAFRAFFMGAALFAVVAMLAWWRLYPTAEGLSGVAGVQWHAHEMVFGYALATVTGFLLTAVMNWSGGNSASGWPLAVLFGLWLGARLGFLLDVPLVWIAVLDSAFTLGLFAHFMWPVWRQKLWPQLGLAAKFLLLAIANGVFYGGAFGVVEHGMHIGTLLGLFLVLAINLTMMRRLLPFFTKRALRLEPFKQSKWLDGSVVAAFLVLMLLAIWWPTGWPMVVVAALLAALHAWRLWRWYLPGIWKVVLLWPLYLSYAFMILGMALFAGVGLGKVPLTVALHALAAGGIGLLCSAILARIALGHTQRNVFEPPKTVIWVFVLLALTALVRIFLPWWDAAHYALWIGVAQWGWVLAFMWLSVLYWPILTRPAPVKAHGIRL
ncbi:NnrS family protein [Thiomicrorhabdus cannonii]|uniref:NnrS family protein n=1 Tax=Thiomicrorhabdus cannonii TaxID=2748011 RepID=UPI0015C189A9|nr:NnrS family protein [Thiomicrorhabdus cannonii]